jgi:hypothetical protein
LNRQITVGNSSNHVTRVAWLSSELGENTLLDRETQRQGQQRSQYQYRVHDVLQSACREICFLDRVIAIFDVQVDDRIELFLGLGNGWSCVQAELVIFGMKYLLSDAAILLSS